MDETPVGRLVAALARYVAVAGGAALVVVTVVSVVSIIGRAGIPLGLSAVPGDTEIVQAGTLFAVFCFLPWCQLNRGHAIVSIFTDRLPVRAGAAIVLVTDIGMLVLSVFIAWRLGIGLQDKIGNNESTFTLRIPLWWSYASGMLGAVMFAIAAAWCVVRSAANVVSSHPVIPASGAAE